MGKPPPALIVAVFGIWVVWGAMYLFSHIALAQWPPYFIVGARFVIAGTLMFGFLRLRGQALPTAKQWRNAGIVGGLLLVLGTGSTVFAQQWNTSSMASVIAATGTIWIAIFSSFIGRPPRRIEWLGIAIGCVGVVVLASQGQLQANSAGLLIGLFGTISWSVGSVLSQKLDLPKGGMRTAVQMMLAGPVLLSMSLVRGEHVSLQVSPQTWGALGVLIIGSWLGFGSYMYLLGKAKPALATSYAYMNPVTALLLGTFVAGDVIAPIEFLGIAIILLSVAFIWLASTRQRLGSG